MAFFVVLVSPGINLTAPAKAEVVGPMTTAEYKSKYGKSPSDEGVKGQTDAGYATKTEAQKVADAYNNQFPDAPVPFSHGLSNPLDSLQEVGHFLGVLVTDITDVAMWRSLGWIVLGGIMLIAGVYLWLKEKNLLPEGMPIPVPV